MVFGVHVQRFDRTLRRKAVPFEILVACVAGGIENGGFAAKTTRANTIPPATQAKILVNIQFPYR